MTNRLNTYFDSTKVGRRDYFRQLIFLTFVPLSPFSSVFTLWVPMV